MRGPIVKLLVYTFFIIQVPAACNSLESMNVLNNFERHVGLHEQYSIQKKVIKNNQVMLVIDINNASRDYLKRKFDFEPYESFIKKFEYTRKSHVPFELFDIHTKDKDQFDYWFNDDYDIYGYYLICISKKENRIIYCENLVDK
jgi:hypothetical protein